MSQATEREQILHRLRQHKRYLEQEFGIARIGLFGSFAMDAAGPGSDVDLLVELRRPIGLRFMELADYLESILGRKVDLLTPHGVRSIRLPWIAESIQRSVLYA